MQSRIIFYGLSGLWWGTVFGCVHLLMIASENAGPKLLLADVGITGVLGALFGLLTGSILKFVPQRLRVLSLFKGVKDHLFPSPDKALQFRSRAAATSWTIGVFFLVLLEGLFLLYSAILTRVQAPFFGAAAITLIGVLVLSLSLAIAGVFRSVLSRVIETLVRRFPFLSPICSPLGNLIAAIVITGLQLGLWMQSRSYLEVTEVLPYVPPLSLLIITILSGDFLEQILARVSLGRSRIVFISGLFCLSTAAIAGLQSITVQDKLVKGHSIPSTALRLLQIPFDEDGDGFSPVFGGGDCNDANELVHPNAIEVYGNAIDENCDGLFEAKSVPAKITEPKLFTMPTFDRPLNIVLITISNLRPDHLSFYGYKRETTPNMDAFTSESIYFTQAYSASPTMSYGLASILSGRHASELIRSDSNWPSFDSENNFLASRLKKRGYQTAAFLSHWYFDEGSGLETGFGVWKPRVAEKGRTNKVATAKQVFSQATSFLQNAKEQPFFLWAHTIDPRKAFIEHMDIPRFGRDVISQYDHEVRYVDEMIKPLLAALRARKDWSDTVVIITSEKGTDFGENLDKDGLLPLSEAQQRVPLFIRIPGTRARPITQRVSLTRLAPTILELAQTPDSPLNRQDNGASLIRLLSDSEENTEPVLSELLTEKADQFSLSYIENEHKLLYDGSNRRWRLFDLSNDPREQVDRYADEPKLANKLRRSLARFRSNMELIAPR